MLVGGGLVRKRLVRGPSSPTLVGVGNAVWSKQRGDIRGRNAEVKACTGWAMMRCSIQTIL
jgi:hypothetical protein